MRPFEGLVPQTLVEVTVSIANGSFETTPKFARCAFEFEGRRMAEKTQAVKIPIRKAAKPRFDFAIKIPL